MERNRQTDSENIENMHAQAMTHPVRWPLFCDRRDNAVEQSAWTASATGHHLQTIQTIVENVYVW